MYNDTSLPKDLQLLGSGCDLVGIAVKFYIENVYCLKDENIEKRGREIPILLKKT